MLQLARERVPDRFETMDDVIGKMELEEAGRAYKLLAGFDMESVNRKGERHRRIMGLQDKVEGE